MDTILLQIVTMLAVVVLPMAIFGQRMLRNKKRSKPVVYKIDTDTSEAHYAINEHGFLEEIKASKTVR